MDTYEDRVADLDGVRDVQELLELATNDCLQGRNWHG